MGLLRVVYSVRPYSSVIYLTVGLLIPVFTYGQGIFNNLNYDETIIRSKIEQYAVSVDSLSQPHAIPDNIYYRLIFREILADPSLLVTFRAIDVSVIENLPAHENHNFVVKDQLELSRLCADLAGDPTEEGVLNAANAFDASRIRREQELDAHYAAVVGDLSAEGREVVLQLYQDFTVSKNVTYSTFSMVGLAADVPEIAHVILQNGCDNFAEQLESYTPQQLTLKDQLYTLLVPSGQ
ncbi:MAG: hypothetical protein R3F41_16935 [Gammaproteobacteria bacterium]|nr:hypothetical protein [Pseudomonadales bacterium]